MALTGTCHCWRNAFEIEDKLPEQLTRRTCSFCFKRGHLCAYYQPDRFHVTKGDSDATYRWRSKLIANHFCSACGCDLYADTTAFGTDGKWDDKTRRVAVNARLLDDFEAADWPAPVIDGKHLW